MTKHTKYECTETSEGTTCTKTSSTPSPKEKVTFEKK